MCAILLTVLLVSVGFAVGEDVARCSNESEWRLSLTPYDDGIVGRYGVQLCSAVDRKATAWRLRLAYYKTDAFCRNPPAIVNLPGTAHSLYEEDISFEDNCSQSHVCLNTTFDLVYSACYSIQSSFKINNTFSHYNYSFFNVNNNYTEEFFMSNRAVFDVFNYDSENETLIFHTGVPFASYSVKICKILNMTTGLEVDDSECVEVGAACAAPSGVELRCRTRLPPACHRLRLALAAAWAHGRLADQAHVIHTYCKNSTGAPVAGARARGAWAWAAAGGGALLVLGAAGTLAARRRALRRSLKDTVWRTWQARVSGPVRPPVALPVEINIVLLYAREGACGARLADALAAMFREAGARVHDIYSSDVVAAAGVAPAAWLHAALNRPDTRVVLVQTPALAALYQDRASPGPGFKLSSPLLGRRVAYRAPHFGDTLLHYGLRLATEAADRPDDYRKYFVATVEGAETEVVSRLVPYRRYLLPSAAALLCVDSTTRGATRAAVDAVTVAASELAQRAVDDHHYLMDELLLL